MIHKPFIIWVKSLPGSPYPATIPRSYLFIFIDKICMILSFNLKYYILYSRLLGISTGS